MRERMRNRLRKRRILNGIQGNSMVFEGFGAMKSWDLRSRGGPLLVRLHPTSPAGPWGLEDLAGEGPADYRRWAAASL